MKCQELFSMKNKNKKKLKVSSAADVIGALRVKIVIQVTKQDFPFTSNIRQLQIRCYNTLSFK